MQKVEDSGWRRRAVCLAYDPEVFFPRPGDVSGVEQARRVCESCPVIEACLAEALRIEDGLGRASRFGVMGGLSAGQRHELYRKQARLLRQVKRSPSSGRPAAVCGTAAAWERHQRRGEACEVCEVARARRMVRSRDSGRCGTRSGYQRHRAAGEEACVACRRANADADRRLRNTGSTLPAA